MHGCLAHQTDGIFRSLRMLTAAIALTGASFSTAGAAYDSEGLLEKCSTMDSNSAQTAMIAGVAMGLMLGQPLGGPQRKYCPPNSGRLSAGQYRQVVCKFLGAHPKVVQQDQYTAIAVALLESYPCPSDSK